MCASSSMINKRVFEEQLRLGRRQEEEEEEEEEEEGKDIKYNTNTRTQSEADTFPQRRRCRGM